MFRSASGSGAAGSGAGGGNGSARKSAPRRASRSTAKEFYAFLLRAGHIGPEAEQAERLLEAALGKGKLRMPPFPCMRCATRIMNGEGLEQDPMVIACANGIRFLHDECPDLGHPSLRLSELRAGLAVIREEEQQEIQRALLNKGEARGQSPRRRKPVTA